MDGGTSIESGLDAVVETVGEQAIQAFKALGNETRLAILLTLWDAQEPEGPVTEARDVALSFSTLRKAIGMRDGSQFNYHLKQLVGPFVKQSDEGYTLTPSAEQILHTILTGTLTDAPSLDAEPIDVGCYRCGAPAVIDYEDGVLIERCTICEGTVQNPTVPPGTLQNMYRPPAGLLHRTPQEFFQKSNTWARHRSISMAEGVCPDCSGSVTAFLYVCEAHDTADGTVCADCGQFWNPQWALICEVCKFSWHVPGFYPIFTDTGVRAFYYEHGRDLVALHDAAAFDELNDAFKAVDVVSEDPVELRVTLELDGDRLTVTLDADANVSEVSASKS